MQHISANEINGLVQFSDYPVNSIAVRTHATIATIGLVGKPKLKKGNIILQIVLIRSRKIATLVLLQSLITADLIFCCLAMPIGIRDSINGGMKLFKNRLVNGTNRLYIIRNNNFWMLCSINVFHNVSNY
jgi:hypothetical protein